LNRRNNNHSAETKWKDPEGLPGNGGKITVQAPGKGPHPLPKKDFPADAAGKKMTRIPAGDPRIQGNDHDLPSLRRKEQPATVTVK
jgi:hypothetical protein